MSRSTRLSTREAARLRFAAVLLGAWLAVASAAAAPDYLRADLGEARLAGRGTLTWFGLRVYDAALYVPARFDPAAALAQPFALELTYARRFSGERIAQTSRDEIARLGYGDEAKRARWLAQMQALFPDVEPGTRLAGVHLPGVGARFYRDGRAVGAIEDPEFARAFFAIWLDQRTRAPQLRAQLLGGNT